MDWGMLLALPDTPSTATPSSSDDEGEKGGQASGAQSVEGGDSGGSAGQSEEEKKSDEGQVSDAQSPVVAEQAGHVSAQDGGALSASEAVGDSPVGREAEGS